MTVPPITPSLSPFLGFDERTRISFFKKGLNGELKNVLSYQITLPDIFDEFVRGCINIDNQIRANKKARDSIPGTQGGQFAPPPTTSTSTGTHSGPMDLFRARYRSQKRGPVTDQEKKRRRDNNLFLYCGSSSHWATQCSHKQSRGKPSAAAAITATSEGGVLIPAPAVPVLSSASIVPAQVLYEAKNEVSLQIARICSAPGCHLGVLNLIFFMIPFVLLVSLLVAVFLVFLLLLFLLLVVGLSVPCRNPLCLLPLSLRILFLLLKKSPFMNFLWTLVWMTPY